MLPLCFWPTRTDFEPSFAARCFLHQVIKPQNISRHWLRQFTRDGSNLIEQTKSIAEGNALCYTFGLPERI